MSRAVRTPLRSILFASLALTLACAEPPTKELNQAQGAIDAARAAGADVYAPEDFKAAVSALARAYVAVEQRDYRQALSLALDSKERAREAARAGAGRMAEVRSEAEQSLDTAARAMKMAELRLAAVEGSRLSAAQRATLRGRLEATATSLQEARAALDKQAYPQAKTAGEAALRAVQETMTTLGDAQPRTRRPAARKPPA